MHSFPLILALLISSLALSDKKSGIEPDAGSFVLERLTPCPCVLVGPPGDNAVNLRVVRWGPTCVKAGTTGGRSGGRAASDPGFGRCDRGAG